MYPVKSGRAAHQRDASDVKCEFVFSEGLHDGGPVDTRRKIVDESRIAKLHRGHLVSAMNTEILRDARMRIDFAANIERQLNGAIWPYPSMFCFSPAIVEQSPTDTGKPRALGQTSDPGITRSARQGSRVDPPVLLPQLLAGPTPRPALAFELQGV